MPKRSLFKYAAQMRICRTCILKYLPACLTCSQVRSCLNYGVSCAKGRFEGPAIGDAISNITKKLSACTESSSKVYEYYAELSNPYLPAAVCIPIKPHDMKIEAPLKYAHEISYYYASAVKEADTNDQLFQSHRRPKHFTTYTSARSTGTSIKGPTVEASA